MNLHELETTPVVYNASSIKIISRFSVPAHHETFRLHWHDRMEFLRIHEGELTVFFGTSHVHAKAGDLVIIPPHRLHKGYTEEKAVSYSVIMFDVRHFFNETEASDRFLRPIYENQQLFSEVTDAKPVIEAADFLLGCSASDVEAVNMVAGVYRLLYELYRQCKTENAVPEKSDAFLRDTVQYIEENYTEELNTEILSAHFGYTSSYFCRKFKECTGLTPMNYLKIFRVEKGYRFIKDGCYDISELSMKCGIADANYFTRCFKEHFGHPPTYYVKLQRETAHGQKADL